MTSSRRVLVSLLLVISCAGCGGSSTARSAAPKASPSSPSTALSGTGAYFGLSVADLEAAVSWYSQKLGLHVVMRPPKTDGTSAVVLEGDGLIVELLQRDDGVPLSKVAPGVRDRLRVHGLVKAGAVVRDFDALMAMLTARSVPIAFGPFPATADQRANVIIRDNEGNLIQFFGK